MSGSYFKGMEMRLTVQEVRVLSLIAQGLTDQEIAARLSVAFSTARKHRENLLRKLQARKSTVLVFHYFAMTPPRPSRLQPR